MGHFELWYQQNKVVISEPTVANISDFLVVVIPVQDCCNGIGIWQKQGKVYSGTLAPSDTSLIGRRLQFLPPTYLFSNDPLASIGLDWLQWSLQL